MSLVRNLFTTFVGYEARRHTQGHGLRNFGLGMLAARIATRSVPGALLVGGALIVLGLFTRPVAFLLSGMMAVAYFQFHAMTGGLFPLVNGGELAALYCWVFLYLVFAGPGAFSVDGILAKKA